MSPIRLGGLLFLLCWKTGTASVVPTVFPCSPALPEDLCVLEPRIFTQTDFSKTADVREIMTRLKDAWIRHAQEDMALRDHLLALVSQVMGRAHAIRYPGEIFEDAAGQDNLFSVDRQLSAYESEHGPVVPLDWTLPPEIRMVMVTSERNDEPARDHTVFRTTVFVGLNHPHSLESIRLERYPSEVIFDNSTRGLTERLLGPEKIPFLSLSSPASGVPLAEGLYWIEIRRKHGPKFRGWFFFSNVTPAAPPPILTPSLNQRFPSGQPNLRWIDFHSPKAKPFEHRKLTLNILGDDANPPLAWYHSEIEPIAFRSLMMGKEKGSPRLTRGSYRFSLSLEERWLAGKGLFIGRKSSTTIPFQVSE